MKLARHYMALAKKELAESRKHAALQKAANAKARKEMLIARFNLHKEKQHHKMVISLWKQYKAWLKKSKGMYGKYGHNKGLMGRNWILYGKDTKEWKKDYGLEKHNKARWVYNKKKGIWERVAARKEDHIWHKADKDMHRFARFVLFHMKKNKYHLAQALKNKGKAKHFYGLNRREDNWYHKNYGIWKKWLAAAQKDKKSGDYHHRCMLKKMLEYRKQKGLWGKEKGIWGKDKHLWGLYGGKFAHENKLWSKHEREMHNQHKLYIKYYHLQKKYHHIYKKYVF